MASWLEAARTLHARAIVVDSHCDTTQRLLNPEWDFSKRHDDGHLDIPRLRAGGIGAGAGQLPRIEGHRQRECERVTTQRCLGTRHVDRTLAVLEHRSSAAEHG